MSSQDNTQAEKAALEQQDVTQQRSRHARFGNADATSASSSDNNVRADKVEDTETDTTDNRVVLTEDDCYDELGFNFPEWKKWTILTVIFLVQVSMNFNSSLYSNGLGGISDEFGVSEQKARVGAAIFLILYAFGCELWAPWSEEIGRKPVLQASLFLVNIFQLPVALATNFGSIVVGRALGGLSSAGGSVTLGMVADMWESDNQQFAVAFVVFSSVGGSVLGPVVGGFVQQFLSWRWCIWIQLIFGVFVQVLHLICVPETRTTCMLDNIAKRRRKSGQDPNVYGPNEVKVWSERFSFWEIMAYWGRPFKMFATEPIVLVLSLLSGFSDALIFMFLQSFTLLYGDVYGFNDGEQGLAFLPILVGYFIAWASFYPAIKRNMKARAAHPESEKAQYESRLDWLLYTAPCLPIGLIGFAWCSQKSVPWIASMIFAAVIGIANYSIYMATIDYMICAYGPYSASATGGNGWSRDFLAGVLTIPATPFFTNIGGQRHLEYASTILACIATLLVGAVYVIYHFGPTLRKKSPFACALSDAREEHGGRRVSSLPGLGSGRNSAANSRNNSFSRPSPGSRQASTTSARPEAGSRQNTMHDRTRDRAAQANADMQTEMQSEKV